MYRIILIIIGVGFLMVSCEDMFDNRVDTDLLPEQAFVNYERMRDFGYGVYTFVPKGYDRIDGSLLAAATDEAEHNDVSSDIQLFNLGAWNEYNNPDNQWDELYMGIRKANLFLENTIDYKHTLARDTFSSSSKDTYVRNVRDIGFMRGEIRFLRAYFYFELAKRYGGVPLVTNVLNGDGGKEIERASFEDIVNFIAAECDAVKDSVQTEWSVEGNPASGIDNETGRVTKGTVLGLKGRALLYFASPQHNPSNDMQRWVDAAQAAYDVINLNHYSLTNDYQSLFTAPNSFRSREIIFARRYNQQNFMESDNYPIGTPGGMGRTNPSHNLVDAYERLSGWDESNPYENRDPRLSMTVVVNNSTWNNRTIQLWNGGIDGTGQRASKTGYYLKKFLSPNLDLVQNNSVVYSWILMRYAEVLLNYAEALNEAYGPGTDLNGNGLTALQALNAVRSRPGVMLPLISSSNLTEFRQKVWHERRVELAFEEHRFWDLRRWKIANETLGAPLTGVKIERNGGDGFDYNVVNVENRSFSDKMYLYPIPQVEVNKSSGTIVQNPGWGL